MHCIGMMAKKFPALTAGAQENHFLLPKKIMEAKKSSHSVDKKPPNLLYFLNWWEEKNLTDFLNW